MKEILKTIDLTKDYKKFKLDKINITINSGEIYGLVGPNGAGKTTLMKLLANHENPSSGAIEFFGKTGKNAQKLSLEQMGFMVEMDSMYSYLTGYQNLQYLAKLRGISLKTEYVKSIIKFFGIEEFQNKKFKSYSTGMKQRVQLAGALLNRPKILVLDEPVNGLDPDGILELRRFLRKYVEENDAAIIISSHILTELDMVATRYGFIKKGKLLEEISAEELRNKSSKYMVLEFDESDLEKSVAILEKNGLLTNYKVLDHGKVNVFNNLDIKEVQKTLAKNDIYLKSSTRKEESLEEYYVELMGGKNE